jgi:microcompartment protein CcmK/EutM
MNLGRVTGRIVATIRYPGLEGVKLLLLQPLDERLASRGAPLVAYPLPVQFVPVDATIVGHVEQVAT